jgi:hypothetical protein
MDLMNIQGVLLTIGGITLAKCRPNLETAAPVHTMTMSSFADDHVDEGVEGEEHERRDVLLPARGQEEHLVAQPEEADQHDDRDDRRRGDEALVGADRIRHRRVVHARQHERHHERRHHPDVEGDVDDRSVVAPGERHPVGPGREADRVGPSVVPESGCHRLEVPSERAPRAGQAQAFEQDRPQDQLLPDERLLPPRGGIEEIEP